MKIIHFIEKLGNDDATCLRKGLSGGDFNAILTFYTSFDVDDSIMKVKEFSCLLRKRILLANDTDSSPIQ